MKKINLLLSTLLIPGAISPLFVTTNCNIVSYYDKVCNFVKDKAIEEFITLSTYPRRTGYTRHVCDYLKSKIETLTGVYPKEDTYRGVGAEQSSGNLMFDIPATSGFEEYPWCILQGHMDMVLTAKTDSDLAYARIHGIEVEKVDRADGLILRSKDNKTSLGADNGIGVAIMLALLQCNDWKHGPIRFIITTDEEGGMKGAGAVHSSWLRQGDRAEAIPYLINIDNELIGQMVVSSAGAVESKYNKSFNTVDVTGGNILYELTISGLTGGHSGDTINKGRANALNVLANLYKYLELDSETQLVNISTPESDATNLIYSKAISTFATKTPLETMLAKIDNFKNDFAIKYPNEKNIQISIKTVDEERTVEPINNAAFNRIINFISSIPYGPMNWSDPETKNVVTESNNIGPCTLEEGEFTMLSQSRGNTEELLDDVYNKCVDVTSEILGGYSYTLIFRSPCWIKEDENKLRDLCSEGFNKFNVPVTYDQPHAGLENAWFIKKQNGNIKTVSIGPTIDNAHQVSETLHLDTLDGLIKNVTYMLENLNKIK